MSDFPVLLGEENETPSLGGARATLLRGPQILQSGHVQSMSFVTGSAGWRIDSDGDAEFNNITIRGTIYASVGTIGGWVIGSSSLTDASGAVGMSSAVTGGNDIRFWAGDATPASAEFRVYEDGSMVASSATITGTITATAGSLGTLTISGTLSSAITEPNWEQHLYFNGSNGTRIDTPDSAATSPTSDIDLAILIDPDDGTPSSQQTWATKWSGAGQNGYGLVLQTNGYPACRWSTNGSDNLNIAATVSANLTPGTKTWLRWTMDANDGAGNRLHKYYTAPTVSATDFSPGSWTQVGTTRTTAGTTSIFDSNAKLMIGGYNDGAGEPPTGKAYGLLLNNAYDTADLWASADVKLMFGQSNPSSLVGWPISATTSNASDTGETWTIRGTTQPALTIDQMLAAGVGFTIAGATGRESFNTLISFVEWEETATAVTGSYANAISKTLQLPFSGETCIIELAISARGTDLGENETIFLTPRVTVNSIDHDGGEISDSNPNATGGVGTLAVSNPTIGTLDPLPIGADVSGNTSTVSSHFHTADGTLAAASHDHALSGAPGGANLSGAGSVTLADKHYTLHDIPFAVGPIYVTGTSITATLRVKGTNYTGTPRFRMVARVTRAWS